MRLSVSYKLEERIWTGCAAFTTVTSLLSSVAGEYMEAGVIAFGSLFLLALAQDAKNRVRLALRLEASQRKWERLMVRAREVYSQGDYRNHELEEIISANEVRSSIA